MWKRLLALLVAVMMLCTPAFAEEPTDDELFETAQNVL